MNNTLSHIANTDKVFGQILYVTHSRYDGDWNSIPHNHVCAELFYVISGSGKFFVQGEYVDIFADDLIIVNSHVEHTELSKENQPLEYIVVGIEGLCFNSKDKRFNSNYSVHNYSEFKHEILFYLKTILIELKHPDTYTQQLVQNLLEAMLINMVRRTNTDLYLSPVKKTSKECIFIENYLNNHYKEDIDLNKLSEITFLNKYYLIHAFKQYKGVSPMRYLVLRRIQEAKNLLENTSYNMNDIAIIIGFSSQNYFTYAFKKEIGCSPSQYRKQHIQKKPNKS